MASPQHTIEMRDFNKLYLIGTQCLIYKRIHETNRVVFCKVKKGKRKIISKELIDRNSEILETFPLSEVPKEEISSLRSSGIPGFILKFKERYYYATVNPRINFISQRLFESGHRCSKDCKRLSPMPVELGGCPKVSHDQPHIEDFDFIQIGYETFNCAAPCNAFCVASCCNYEKEPARKELTAKQRAKICRDFADFTEWYLEEVNNKKEQRYL